MKQAIVIVLFLVVGIIGCQQPGNSVFFEECECEKFEFEKIRVTLPNSFAISFPSNDWKPDISLDEAPGITGGLMDSLLRFRGVTVNRMRMVEGFVDQLGNYELLPEGFELIDQGVLNFRGESCPWAWIAQAEEDPIQRGIYMTYPLYEDSTFFTFSFFTSNMESPEIEICEMENFIHSLEVLGLVPTRDSGEKLDAGSHISPWTCYLTIGAENSCDIREGIRLFESEFHTINSALFNRIRFKNDGSMEDLQMLSWITGACNGRFDETMVNCLFQSQAPEHKRLAELFEQRHSFSNFGQKEYDEIIEIIEAQDFQFDVQKMIYYRLLSWELSHLNFESLEGYPQGNV